MANKPRSGTLDLRLSQNVISAAEGNAHTDRDESNLARLDLPEQDGYRDSDTNIDIPISKEDLP